MEYFTSTTSSLSILSFVSSVVLTLALKSRITRVSNSESSRYKIVALDLDGTTLNSNHSLTQTTIDTIRTLSSKGVQICIATGRSFGAVLDTLGTLKLGVEVPVVCLNGAMCIKVSKDAQHIDKVFDSLVSPSAAAKLLEFAESEGLVAQYYIDSKVYAAPKNKEHHDLLDRYCTLTGKSSILSPIITNQLPYLQLQRFC